MSFLGVGAAEVGMILLIALILIGPQNFPQVMRQGGRWYRVARAFSSEIMKDVRSAVDEIEEEVKREGGDLTSMRDMLNIEQDLRQVQSDFRNATDDVNTITRGDEVRPREEFDGPATPVTAATPRPTARGWWEDRDPNDPFVKLERSRAAAYAASMTAKTAEPAEASPAPTVAAEEPAPDTDTTPADRDGAST
ncbi:MAG: hypothetical protein O2798_04600 [Chloroflexi bacterium]|nr:hypothetical protein [Chloroflexota bacterium]